MPSVQAFRVYARCRPLNNYELGMNSKKAIQVIDPTTLTINSAGDYKQHLFQLDSIFNENQTNAQIFEQAVIPLADNVLNGINSTVFAYGITGSGKSFTMFGKQGCTIQNCQNLSDLGIIPQVFTYLLKESNENIKIRLSYLEIYNEQVFDLLSPNHTNLAITEDQISGVVVNDLSQIQVHTVTEANMLIQEGNTRRVVAETKANQFSSRSHAIVVIIVEKILDDQIYVGKFSLVDLAGSEKQTVHQNHSQQTKGIRTFQGSNINRSLLTLGNCINMLSEKKNINNIQSSKNVFIPYRDSKLTRLLKDSLGGNTKTAMIACISQSSLFYEETLNTLKYACRATKIQKVVQQNVKDTRTIEKYKKQIQALKKENSNLKLQINKGKKAKSFQMVTESTQNMLLREELMNLVKAVEDRCFISKQFQTGSQQKQQEIINNIIQYLSSKSSNQQEIQKKKRNRQPQVQPPISLQNKRKEYKDQMIQSKTITFDQNQLMQTKKRQEKTQKPFSIPSLKKLRDQRIIKMGYSDITLKQDGENTQQTVLRTLQMLNKKKNKILTKSINQNQNRYLDAFRNILNLHNNLKNEDKQQRNMTDNQSYESEQKQDDKKQVYHIKLDNVEWIPESIHNFQNYELSVGQQQSQYASIPHNITNNHNNKQVNYYSEQNSIMPEVDYYNNIDFKLNLSASEYMQAPNKSQNSRNDNLDEQKNPYNFDYRQFRNYMHCKNMGGQPNFK